MKTHPLLPSCYLLSFGSFPTSLLPLPFFLAPFVATIYMELSLPTDWPSEEKGNACLYYLTTLTIHILI
jgi:hypothetical protein